MSRRIMIFNFGTFYTITTNFIMMRESFNGDNGTEFAREIIVGSNESRLICCCSQSLFQQKLERMKPFCVSLQNAWNSILIVCRKILMQYFGTGCVERNLHRTVDCLLNLYIYFKCVRSSTLHDNRNAKSVQNNYHFNFNDSLCCFSENHRLFKIFNAFYQMKICKLLSLLSCF